MNTKNFKDFWDCRDTKIGYFLVITQESEDSKRLSDLAYEFTDMGGYDNPLEEYKKQYKQDFVAREVERIAQEKAEAKERIEREYKVALAEYKQTCKEYKELGKPTKGVPKPVKEKMPQFPTKSSIKPVNEIDGGDFNYDWIPLEILHPYASGDTDCCLRIYNELVRRMEQLPKMYELWTSFYPNLTRALAHIESTGMAIDTEYAETIEREYSKEEQRILAEIRKFPAVQQLESEHMALYQAGLAEWAKPPKERDSEIAKLRDKYKISETDNKVEFNPSSSTHKGKLLYKVMGLTLPYDKESIKDKPFDDGVPENEITWADYRTNKHALEYLAEHFEQAKEIAGLLLDYSKVNTLKNNFAQKLPAMASNKDGRVHGSFNLTGTQCVSGDTLIVTDNGITPIESLSDLREPKQFAPLDIKVPTHIGSLESANFFYSGFSNGLRLTLGDGTELTVTNEHPLMRNNYYTAESKRTPVKANYARYREHVKDNSWIPASQLAVGDWIQLAVGTEVYGNITELSYNRADYVKKITNRKEVTLPTVLTPELAEWLGMYMADGHFSASNGSFCIHLTNDDDSVRDRFKELSEKLFAVEAKHKYQKDRSPSVAITSKMLGEWLSDMFHINEKALGKNVPDLVLRSTKEVQQGFIRGLTLDSATDKKKYPSLVLSSVSKNMMHRVRAMLTNMSILTRINVANTYDADRLPLYQLYITFDDLTKFMQEIGTVEQCKHDRLLDKFAEYNGTKRPKFQGVMRCEKTTLGKIVKVEPVENVEFFDLNVPVSHSFVGNGVVNHNTSRLSSNNPNLQQVPRKVGDPRRFDYNYPIKRLFKTSFENGAMIQADYSALA